MSAPRPTMCAVRPPRGSSPLAQPEGCDTLPGCDPGERRSARHEGSPDWAAWAGVLAAALLAGPVWAAELSIDLRGAGDNPAIATSRGADGRLEIRVPAGAKLSFTQDAADNVAHSVGREGGLTVIWLTPGPGVGYQLSDNGSVTTITLRPAVAAAAAAAPVAAPVPTPAVVVASHPAAAAAAPAPAAAAKPPTTVSPLPVAVDMLGSLVDNLKKQGDAAATDYKNYLVDMLVPATPAFAVLGVAPKTVIDPGSPRDFGMSVAQNLSNSAALGNGVGFDIAPYMLFYGSTLTLSAYQKSDLLPILGRSQLSFAAIKSGTDQTAATKAAFGLSIPLVDEGDPRRKDSALAVCYGDALDKWRDNKADFLTAARAMLGAGGKEAAETTMKAPNAALSAAFDGCRQVFKKTHWNASRWTLGWGRAYEKRDAGIQPGAQSLWSTYALRIGAMPPPRATTVADLQGQALFHLRRTLDEQLTSTTDPRGFTKRTSTLAGLGIKFGSDTLAFSVEASRSNGRYDTGETENARKFALGGEYQINKDLWFVLSIGGEGSLAKGKDNRFVLGSFKYGLGSEKSGAF